MPAVQDASLYHMCLMPFHTIWGGFEPSRLVALGCWLTPGWDGRCSDDIQPTLWRHRPDLGVGGSSPKLETRCISGWFDHVRARPNLGRVWPNFGRFRPVRVSVGFYKRVRPRFGSCCKSHNFDGGLGNRVDGCCRASGGPTSRERQRSLRIAWSPVAPTHHRLHLISLPLYHPIG